MPSIIDVDGLTIRYETNTEDKSRELDKKIRVVLFHGNAFSLENWMTIGTLDVLKREGFAAYAVDLPAGRASKSSKVEKKNIREYVPILKAIFRKLGIAEDFLVLVGPSMGGGFALAYSMANPEATSGLVLISPSLRSLDESSLSSIKTPTLLIWGERDNVFPLREYAKSLKNKLENARLLILKEAGHAAYLDKPDEFHEVLLDFLNGLIE